MTARRAEPIPTDPSPRFPVGRERIELGFLALGDLQRMPVVELRALANGLGVTLGNEKRKQEIVLRILEEYVGKRGLMFGEGVAEVMPDGFGFLRSPAYSYRGRSAGRAEPSATSRSRPSSRSTGFRRPRPPTSSRSSRRRRSTPIVGSTSSSPVQAKSPRASSTCSPPSASGSAG
jgi:hypothetical protein